MVSSLVEVGWTEVPSPVGSTDVPTATDFEFAFFAGAMGILDLFAWEHRGWAPDVGGLQVYRCATVGQHQMGMDVAREGDTACTLRESRVEVRVYPSLGEVLGCGEGNGDS